VLHEDGVGHRAHATRDRRDGAGDGQDGGQVDIADDAPASEHVDAAVDDDRSVLDGPAMDEPWRASRHHDHLCASDLLI
jgi:hypothetical protein